MSRTGFHTRAAGKSGFGSNAGADIVPPCPRYSARSSAVPPPVPSGTTAAIRASSRERAPSLGAAVGRDVAHRSRTRSRYVTEERCEIDYELREREVVSGYRVGYEYGDDVYYTQTRHRPGPTIRVEVILEPESY